MPKECEKAFLVRSWWANYELNVSYNRTQDMLLWISTSLLLQPLLLSENQRKRCAQLCFASWKEFRNRSNSICFLLMKETNENNKKCFPLKWFRFFPLRKLEQNLDVCILLKKGKFNSLYFHVCHYIFVSLLFFAICFSSFFFWKWEFWEGEWCLQLFSTYDYYYFVLSIIFFKSFSRLRFHIYVSRRAPQGSYVNFSRLLVLPSVSVFSAFTV